MNSIVAFIQPFQLERVVDALRSLPRFPGISVSRVEGFGRLEAHPPRKGERTEVDPFKPRVRLEIYCRGTDVASIAETIRQAARTGNPGDGLILVGDLAWVYRIRTDEEGQSALGSSADETAGR
jgi:nitrogen regulatory protein PII